MIAELFRELMQAAAASAGAVLVIALLRKPLRKLIGAEAAYRVWLLVPAAVLAVWLPAPTLVPVAVTSMGVGEVGAVSLTGLAPAPSWDIVPWLMLIWLLGVAVSALGFAVRQRRFNQRIQRQPKRPFDVIDGEGPAVVGGWRARIVLPADFRERYSDDEQQLILAHEQQHVRRGDLRAQTVATALRGVFWFNPLMHVGASLFRFDQELACDAAVLKQFPHERRRYADTMLKTQLAHYGLPLACHWQATHSLKERITMLKLPTPGRARRILGLMTALAVISGGTYSAWAAQPRSADATKASAAAPAPFTHLHEDESLTTPTYPPEALAKGVEGKVVLDVLEGVDGHMVQIKVASAEPAGVFEAAAIAAARQWKLRPFLVNGVPVEHWWRIPVQFAKHDPDAKPADRAKIGEAGGNDAGDIVDTQSRELNPPKYPAAALARAQGGKVVLEVDYDPAGAPTAIKVVESEPAGTFDDAVLAAAWKWHFNPAMVNGMPVAGRVRVPVTFVPKDPTADDQAKAKS